MQVWILLKYNFLNREKRRYLLKYWYINWCWGKGGINFSAFMDEAIENLKWFDINYFIALKNDLEKLCTEHDIDFWLWGTIIDFYKANFSLAYKIFKLLEWKKYWKKINNFLGRFFIFLTILYLINKYGKKYFYFWKKRTLEELFKNFKSNKNY